GPAKDGAVGEGDRLRRLVPSLHHGELLRLPHAPAEQCNYGRAKDALYVCLHVNLPSLSLSRLWCFRHPSFPSRRRLHRWQPPVAMSSASDFGQERRIANTHRHRKVKEAPSIVLSEPRTLLPLEHVVPIGIGSETSGRPDLTHDDVHLALAAAFYPNCVL